METLFEVGLLNFEFTEASTIVVSIYAERVFNDFR